VNKANSGIKDKKPSTKTADKFDLLFTIPGFWFFSLLLDFVTLMCFLFLTFMVSIINMRSASWRHQLGENNTKHDYLLECKLFKKLALGTNLGSSLLTTRTLFFFGPRMIIPNFVFAAQTRDATADVQTQSRHTPRNSKPESKHNSSPDRMRPGFFLHL